MTQRVLCEINIDEWTGMNYPSPYNGNCYYTDDSEDLRTWKKEVLKEHPELKGHLKIMTLNSMSAQQQKVKTTRESLPSYQEYIAYIRNGGYIWRR